MVTKITTHTMQYSNSYCTHQNKFGVQDRESLATDIRYVAYVI